jgi:hypothetical protein
MERNTESPGVFYTILLYNYFWMACLEYFPDWVFSLLRHDGLSFNSIDAKYFGIAYTAQQVGTEVTERLHSQTTAHPDVSEGAIWWIYTIRNWALQPLQWNKFECVIPVLFITPEELFYFAGSHSTYSTIRS